MAYASRSRPSLRRLLEAWERTRTALLSRGDRKDDDLEVSIALSQDGPRLYETGRNRAALVARLPRGIAQEDLITLFPDGGEASAAALVETGLALYEGDRLRMLSPVREALRRLRQPTREEHRALVGHYLRLVADLGSKIGGSGGQAAVARLEPEAANFDSCFVRAVEDLDLDAAFRAVYGLTELMRFRNVGSARILLKAGAVARSAERSRGEANCIRSLGDIALIEGEPATGRERWLRALELYQKIPEPYSIGAVHRRLALSAEDDETISRHIDLARDAWLSIDLPDPVESLTSLREREEE